MIYDLFNWSIITAIISYTLLFALSLLTSNDAYYTIAMVAIFLVSIILLSKKNPAQLSFKSAGILGAIVMTTALINGKVVHVEIAEFVTYLAMYAVTFVVAGFIGKIIKRK